MSILHRAPRALLAAAIFALLAGPGVAHASYAAAQVQQDVSYNGGDLCRHTSGGGGLSNAPLVSCIGTPHAPDQGMWQISASASADYGTLRAFADLRLTAFGMAYDPHATYDVLSLTNIARASFSDTLNFSSGSFWAVTVGITGTLHFSSKDNSHDVSDDNLPMQFCFSFYGFCTSSASTDQRGLHTFVLPIPKDHVLTITPSLTIEQEYTVRPQGYVVTNPLTLDQYVDVGHTVRFISSQVLDANMQALADATASSASGYDYLHPVPEVPEPPTSTLAAAGLGLMALRLVRRQPPRPAAI